MAGAAGLRSLVATIVDGVTSTGVETLRDVLLACLPLVLHAEVYATAALAGAAAMPATSELNLGSRPTPRDPGPASAA